MSRFSTRLDDNTPILINHYFILASVLIVYLWPKVKVFHSRQDSARVHLVSVVAGSLVLMFVAVGPVYSVSFLESATAGGTWPQAIRSLLASLHSLDVQDKRLYLGAESTLPSDACSASDTTLALNLTGRSFRGANLTNSILCSAVMVEAELQRATLVNVQFERADLRDAQLQGAILGNAQFGAAILIRANLQDVIAAGERLRIQGTTLSGDQVSVERVSGAQFEEADLTGADLRGAILANSLLSNTVMTGAQLAGANLVNADFEGADLRDAQLQGAIIGGARFEAANLRGANLQDTVAAGEGESLRVGDLQDDEEVGNRRLSGAWFERADLTEAKLQGAMLPNSRFQDALLTRAQLQAAVLGAADLRRVDLEGAVLMGAILGPVRLQGANMREAQLQSSFLGNAQLEGADLTDAKLQGANLTGGRRYGTIFRNAELQGANLANGSFQGADMRGVRLQGATLDNTDLMGADLEGAQLQGIGPWSETPQGGFRGRLYYRADTPSEFTGVSFRDARIVALGVVSGGVEMRKEGVSEEVVGDFVRRMFEQLAREGRLEGGLDELAAGLREMSESGGLDEDTRQFFGEIAKVLEEIVPQGTVRREPIFVEGVYSEEDAERWVGEYLHEVCDAFREDMARLESRLGFFGIGESEIDGWEEECPAAPSSAPE